jgi:carboxyl-terminal processing protease
MLMSIKDSLRFATVLAVGALIGLTFSIAPTVKAERTVAEPPASSPTSAPWLESQLLAEVMERIRTEYVEELSEEELIEAAIRGLVTDLDGHSAFLDKRQYEEVRVSTSGEYSGVGIEVVLEKGVVRVVNTLENTPAAHAGVAIGDRIVAIDDVPVSTETIDDTIDRMRGPTGTPVKVTIERAGESSRLHFILQRANVRVQSVRHALLEQAVGYVRIKQFSETTTPDVERAVALLQDEAGQPLNGLVLDLRDNPGGVLEAAAGVADLFLEGGVIVSAVGRAPDAVFEMTATPGDVLNGAPMVVLVNAGSASASEIVAGALRDHKRATLVGQKTYGKGSVQTVMPLSNGQAIKLTTSQYLTPSGESIHRKGLMPDRVITEKELKAEGATPAVFGHLASDYELRVALGMMLQQRTIRQSQAN